MPGILSRLWKGSDPKVRGRLIAVYALLLSANVAVWLWAYLALRGNAVLFGSAFLAYAFGLRHAVDADHIAAIDNSTRKLMQQGDRPVTVGLFFALGHSLVVLLLSVAVGFAAAKVSADFDGLKAVGGVVSALASALFLFLLAAFNFLVLISVWRTFHAVKRGEAFSEDDFDILLNSRGFLARLFRPLFRLATKSWHLFPIGFLFGLGFDTATEVALLGISATQAAEGMPVWSIMVFPALFAAGMSLIDTTDGILMLGAYNWAFVRPVRKLYYNLVITGISVVVALLIGGIEGLGLIGDLFGLKGVFWGGTGSLNDNLNGLGFAIIGLFILAWAASVIVYRYLRLDAIEPGVAQR